MVIWSRPAKQDLKNIHDHIASDSRFYAKKVVRDIIEKFPPGYDAPRRNQFFGRSRVLPLVPHASTWERTLGYSYALLCLSEQDARAS